MLDKKECLGRESKMREEFTVFSLCLKLSHLSSWSELLNKDYVLEM